MFTAIGSFFSGLLGGLAKWAATIMGFMAGKYHEKNKANKKALEIKAEQLAIAGKRKYRRDELLAKARKRKR